jgi:hypothetical protein
MPIYPNTSAEERAFEVLDLWTHCPTTWAAHIDTTLCPTAAELIKIATDKREQLQASNVADLSRLVRAEMNKQNQRRFANAQLADIEEAVEELEFDSLTAETKPSQIKASPRAPGTYPYPPANNRSCKTPLRPCRNCGSPLHYDRDCASWRKLGSGYEKPKSNSKLNEVYHKSYIAMVDALDDEYEAQCAAFLTIIDSDVTTETPTTEVFTADYEKPSSNAAEREPDETRLLEPTNLSHSWAEIAVNLIESDDLHLPEEGVYEPQRIWERPAGHAVQGVDAFKVLCHVNSLNEPAVAVIGDSGAAPTLISHKFLQSLQASKPKPRTGSKLKLIQLTGSAGCSEYVKLDLYFRSQLGPVCLKGVEAYVVKGMEANLLIGEDTQLAWQLHTIRPDGKRHWKVGDSPHCIPALPGHAPTETFTVRWTPGATPVEKKAPTAPIHKLDEGRRSQWNAVAKEQLSIQPESIATITVVSRGAPDKEALYLEGIGLKRGSDSFIQVPDGLVHLDSKDCFQVKIANTTKRRIIVRSGELVGHLFKASKTLKAAKNMSEQEIEAFSKRASYLATLIPKLSSRNEETKEESFNNNNESIAATSRDLEEVDPTDTEHLGWGPKTADPGPDRIYPSEKLRKVINVDPQLEPSQREALYKVVERNQAAFGFDGRLGHLKSEVHIELMPGTKPISMPPYYASPAKREAIDKQIDLWLSQGVIEESKSPWGAPIIIVYRNGKPRVCIDFRRLNKATVADQHPIPKQTDILQALSGAQYLSVFDALSGFTQLEFDEESRPITAIRTHRGLHHFKRMPFGWRNGPPVFQRAMQEILSPFLWIFTLVYIDDIVVYSKSFEDHLKHVDLVLKAIANSGLTLSPPKCHLGY